MKYFTKSFLYYQQGHKSLSVDPMSADELVICLMHTHEVTTGSLSILGGSDDKSRETASS